MDFGAHLSFFFGRAVLRNSRKGILRVTAILDRIFASRRANTELGSAFLLLLVSFAIMILQT